MTGSWASSSRSSRLPPDWPARVEATAQRAEGRCEAEHHDPRCDGTGSEADHHDRGDDHDLANLRWLNHWCHQRKTQAEAAAAHAAFYGRARRRPEPHPIDVV